MTLLDIMKMKRISDLMSKPSGDEELLDLTSEDERFELLRQANEAVSKPVKTPPKEESVKVSSMEEKRGESRKQFVKRFRVFGNGFDNTFVADTSDISTNGFCIRCSPDQISKGEVIILECLDQSGQSFTATCKVVNTMREPSGVDRIGLKRVDGKSNNAAALNSV